MNRKQKLSVAHCIVDCLTAIAGKKNVLTSAEDTKPFLTEERGLFFGPALAVVRPSSTSEISDIIKACADSGCVIVPQGGNTGLTGAQTPVAGKKTVVLSLSRLNRIRDLDPVGNTVTCDAGVVLQNLHEAAETAGKLFPLTLGSKGSCQIGGNIATNAGGTAVLSYGNMRDLVLGLEVVLADGQIWNGLRTLKKDNTGYDLKHLFIGSEGTLGIITAATLKLFPLPQGQAVSFAHVPSPEVALSLFNRFQDALGPDLTGFEIIPQIGIDMTERHEPALKAPLSSRSPWSVLIEVSSGIADDEPREKSEALLEAAYEKGEVTDAVLAQSKAQADALWELRHGLSWVQKKEGGSIKHDVSVPVADIPRLLDEGIRAARELIPDCRPVPFGHLGDGNIHFNISQPVGADKEEFLARRDEMNSVIHGIVLKLGGSISAEHGIGQLKRDLLAAVKSPVEMDLMKKIKETLDPSGLFNPGKVL